MSKGKSSVPEVGGKLSVPPLASAEEKQVEATVETAAGKPVKTEEAVKTEKVGVVKTERVAAEKPVPPPVEQPVDLGELMAGRLAPMRHELRSANPLFENNVFDFTGAGFPSRFSLHPVAVPDRNNELISGSQHRVLRSYVQAGYQFVTVDMVTDRPGRAGRAFIPAFEDHDGRVVVNGCFIMYIDKDHVNRKRRDSMARTVAEREGKWSNSEERLSQGQRFEVQREDVMLDEIMGSREGKRGAAR